LGNVPRGMGTFGTYKKTGCLTAGQGDGCKKKTEVTKGKTGRSWWARKKKKSTWLQKGCTNGGEGAWGDRRGGTSGWGPAGGPNGRGVKLTLVLKELSFKGVWYNAESRKSNESAQAVHQGNAAVHKKKNSRGMTWTGKRAE